MTTSFTSTATTLRIRVLGIFAVEVGDRSFPADAWRSKAAALVKVLALAPRGRLHREQVLESLWPEMDPDAASNNLHYTLHMARRLLAPVPRDCLRLRGQVLTLGPDGAVDVDLWTFERAVEQAIKSGEIGDLSRAVELYAGELLPDDRYEEWAVERRQEVHERYVTLLLEMARLEAARGGTAAAVAALRQALAADPTREEAHALLMKIFAAAGQRQQSLRQYGRLVEILGREFGVGPSPETEEAHARVLAGTLAPAQPPVTHQPAIRLPAELSSFVGRKAETEQIAGLLRTARLVTLTGPGGAGKTRLALHIVRGLADALTVDAWLVELASADASSVPGEIAAALEIREEPGESPANTLKRALESRRLLLVLDNCEHVVDSCARLVQYLLQRCPWLQVLATSREPLGIPGESVVMVAPLPVPREKASLAGVTETESVRLLTDRIRYRHPSFRIDEENVEAVVQICRQLEGLPLALELVAARVGALSLQQIASRLSDSLGLLTQGIRTAQPRQQTLRGALDWSLELLSDLERAVFAWLSVFRSGWDLSAAGALVAPDGLSEIEVLDLLSRLVDRSLVVAEPQIGGEIRYRMLEPIRQYAAEALRRRGEEECLRARHARLYLTFAQRAASHLSGPEQAEWLARLEREHDNLRAALLWASALPGSDMTGIRLAVALWLFWYVRGHLREGDEWLRAMLGRHPERTAARAEALRAIGALAYKQRQYERAIPSFEGAILIFRELGDTAGEGACTANLASALQEHGQTERALELQHQALALRRLAGDEVGVASTISNIGVGHYIRGEYKEARPLLEESLELYRRLGDIGSVAIGLNNLGELALREGQLGEVASRFHEGLQLAHQVGETEVIASCLDGLAHVAQLQGQIERAAHLYTGADAIRHAIGSPLRPQESEEHKCREEKARAAIGANRFDEIARAALGQTPDEIVRHALQPVPVPSPASNASPSELSPREQLIAVLVMQGLTNREIAGRVGIGDRTVETHIRRAMRKLHLSSRAQLAGWVAQEGTSTTS